MSGQLQRATLLAVVASAGEEAGPPGGTLAISTWRGVRTILVTLQGSDDPLVREAASRAATLLGVESHFYWNVNGADGAQRLARVLRALQPGVLISNQGARSLVEEAWILAVDPQLPMPGLPLFDGARARLWSVAREAAGARIDTSAARPLLHALRFYYSGSSHEAVAAGAWQAGEVTPFERFDLLRGVPVPNGMSLSDLFVGLVPEPPRPPISFLAEE